MGEAVFRSGIFHNQNCTSTLILHIKGANAPIGRQSHILTIYHGGSRTHNPSEGSVAKLENDHCATAPNVFNGTFPASFIYCRLFNKVGRNYI